MKQKQFLYYQVRLTRSTHSSCCANPTQKYGSFRIFLTDKPDKLLFLAHIFFCHAVHQEDCLIVIHSDVLIHSLVYDDILGSTTNNLNCLPVGLQVIQVFQCLSLHRLHWRSQRVGCCLHVYRQNCFKRSETLSWELPCQT